MLTQEQKEYHWKHKISGSMVKRILEEPRTVLAERLGWQEREAPGDRLDPKFEFWLEDECRKDSDCNPPLAPEPRVKYMQTYYKEMINDKLEWGNLLEDKIIEGANLLKGYNIKIDKTTFQSIVDPIYTANIDGFEGGETIEEADTIIEVKNIGGFAKKEAIERRAYEQYWPQLQYYMWFFNKQKGKYLFLFRGFQLKTVEIARDENFLEDMFNKIHIWQQALEQQNPDLITWGDGQ